MKKIIVFLIAILLFGVSAEYAINEYSGNSAGGQTATNDLDIGKGGAGIPREEKTKFLQKMKDYGFDGWSAGAVSLDSIQFVPDPLGEKNYVVKFTVKHGDYVHGGSRAELDKDYQDPYGSEVWYSWSFLIPQNYKDTSLKNFDTGTSNWQIIGQWHDQPNFAKGEKWKTYPKNSPSISMEYIYLTTKDPEYNQIIDSGEAKSITGYQEGLDEQAMIALSYGVPPKTVAIAPIEKGKWHNLVFHIKWSQENDGFIEVFVNDESLTKGKIYGRNMYNEVSHYLKIGLYRNPDIESTNSVYFNEVRHGTSYEELVR